MEKPPFSSMIFLWPVSYRNWSVRCHSFDPPLLPPIIFTSLNVPDLDEENIYPRIQSVCIHILYIYTVLITLKVSGAMFNLIIHTLLDTCAPKKTGFIEHVLRPSHLSLVTCTLIGSYLLVMLYLGFDQRPKVGENRAGAVEKWKHQPYPLVI